MSEMEIPEELVHEVGKELAAVYAMAHHAGYMREWPTPTGSDFAWSEEKAKAIITRICQAIERGELKLPNEVGRDTIGYGVYKRLAQLRDGDIVIALRPEEKK